MKALHLLSFLLLTTTTAVRGVTWVQVQAPSTEPGVPSARYDHICALYGNGGSVVLHGGRMQGWLGFYNDSWVYDVASGKWAVAPDTAPCNRSQADGFTWRNTAFMYGGAYYYRNEQHAEKQAVLGDLLRFDASRREWLDVPYSSATAAPTPRFGYAAQVVGNTLVVFGGKDGCVKNREPCRNTTPSWADRDQFNDTWTADLGASQIAWKQVMTPVTPGVRHQLGSWSDNKRFVFVSNGRWVQNKTEWAYGDTWKFDVKSGEWSVVQKTAPKDMIPRWSPCTATWKDRYAVMFGGRYVLEWEDYHWLNDTWVMDMESPSPQWVLVPAETAPYPREGAKCVAIGENVFLFAGKYAHLPKQEVAFNDIWSLHMPTVISQLQKSGKI